MLNESKDTLICFSINQSKFLLKKSVEAEWLDSLNTLSGKEILNMQKVIQTKDSIISIKEKIIKNNELDSKVLEEEKDLCYSDVAKKQEKIEKLKLLNKITVAVSAATLVVLLILAR